MGSYTFGVWWDVALYAAPAGAELVDQVLPLNSGTEHFQSSVPQRIKKDASSLETNAAERMFADKLAGSRR